MRHGHPRPVVVTMNVLSRQFCAACGDGLVGRRRRYEVEAKRIPSWLRSVHPLANVQFCARCEPMIREQTIRGLRSAVDTERVKRMAAMGLLMIADDELVFFVPKDYVIFEEGMGTLGPEHVVRDPVARIPRRTRNVITGRRPRPSRQKDTRRIRMKPRLGPGPCLNRGTCQGYLGVLIACTSQ